MTGTAFDWPMVVQIDRLSANRGPDSGDIGLQSLLEGKIATDHCLVDHPRDATLGRSHGSKAVIYLSHCSRM